MGSLPHGSRLVSADHEETPAGSTIESLAWLGAFTVGAYVFSLPQLAATVPGSELRLISIPLALFETALILRPAREWGLYGLVYLIVSLSFDIGSPHVDFAAARVAIETVQTMAVVWMLDRFFYHRFDDPMMVGAWGIAVVALTAIGALLILVAAGMWPMSPADVEQQLGGGRWLAWRFWWLGNACSYLSLAGPAATLINLRRRLRLLVGRQGTDRRQFIGLTAALTVTSIFSFRFADLPALGLPPDVILAVRLLPVPFAMAMAARFRANGAAIAILVFTIIGIYSAASPATHPAGPPLLATPRHMLVLMTTLTCMVLAGISRQLSRALNDALEASEMKSRFIAMLNHELRTPLNAILGFSELMRLQNVRALDAALGPIENIHASGQRLLAMIEGLLGQADRGASAFDLNKQHVPVEQALASVLGDLRSDIEQTGTAIVTGVADDLMVEADPRALKQMLVVLLGYPLRFVGADSVISVTGEHVGTDTIIEVNSRGLVNAVADDRDKLEIQLVEALALAHGARLHVVQPDRQGRVARLTFFATRAIE